MKEIQPSSIYRIRNTYVICTTNGNVTGWSSDFQRMSLGSGHAAAVNFLGHGEYNLVEEMIAVEQSTPSGETLRQMQF